MTHWRLASETWRSPWIEGNATFTIATSRMTMNCAVTTRARALQRLRPMIAESVNRTPSRSLEDSTISVTDHRTRYTLQTMASTVIRQMPKELLQSTGFLLKRLGMNMKERSYASFEPTGFTPFHHGVLSVLDEGARKTQAEIADALGYDRSQLVGILDDLQERGLAE